jgi:hypothetical protein
MGYLGGEPFDQPCRVRKEKAALVLGKIAQCLVSMLGRFSQTVHHKRGRGPYLGAGRQGDGLMERRGPVHSSFEYVQYARKIHRAAFGQFGRQQPMTFEVGKALPRLPQRVKNQPAFEPGRHGLARYGHPGAIALHLFGQSLDIRTHGRHEALNHRVTLRTPGFRGRARGKYGSQSLALALDHAAAGQYGQQAHHHEGPELPALAASGRISHGASRTAHSFASNLRRS